MYSSYNIPQYNPNMQKNNYQRSYPNNGDRFFGGFFGPFILGGITGSLLTPRNNYPIYQPGPPIYYYPPRPVPYYNSTYNYY